MMSAGDDRKGTQRHEIVRRPLLTASIEGGKTVDRVEIKQITLLAHQETGLHLHPCPTVGHVTEGTILFQVEGQPARVLKAGEAFYEPANVRMLHFDNAGEEPAAFIIYYLLGPGEHELITILSGEAN
jgi:quercetin dioxygenase-like cupin family protein